jgi:hypothetical protein
LQSAGTTAITVDTSQNVGIGTTSPQSTVGVNVGLTDTKGVVLQYLGQARGAFLLNPTAGEIRMGAINTSGAYFPTFYSNNAEAMRILSGGAICMGTTASISSGFTTISYSGAVYNGLSLSESNNTSSTTFIVFGLGTTPIGTITRVAGTSAVSYNTTSDQRLKSNIADSESVIDKLMAVKVRQFDWTEGDLHQDYGFIAQELEPTLSGVVTKGKTDEDMWQMDYAKLTPHLVKAIQELKAINDTQTTTINALTARIVALEAK